jgi:hypothetical protein
MSEYGRVIYGGKAMTKGLTKGINDKRDSREDEFERRNVVATAVLNAYKQKNLSGPSTNNVKPEGKTVTFKKATAPTKV